MKKFSRCIMECIILLIIMPCHLSSQNSVPLDFNKFCKDGTKTTEAYYKVYNSEGKYYLEIPYKGLSHDVLITAQVVKGISAFVSPSSGIVHFTIGHNKTVDMYRNIATETSVDTTDQHMMSAIRKSGLVPVTQSFPIVAYGKDGKSPIIDLTQDINNSVGLFAMNAFSLLSHPDPTRSGIEKISPIDNGVVFLARRTQTDYINDPNSHHGEDVASSFMIEMLMQELPRHKVTMKITNPAYGFKTISLFEYDPENYVSFDRNYIQHWHLDASKKELKKQLKGEAVKPDIPICVYIDPVIPQPFVESIKKGVEAWNEPFKKAGWKNVFYFSNNDKDASLSYKKILFRWGNAYNDNNSDLIIDPVNGEIVCARVNIMDEKADDLLNRYFLQCGDIDPRILKDVHSLDIRKSILTVQIEKLMAGVLGMEDNGAASTAFSVDDLRSEKWLDTYGTSASITSQLTFNYLAKPEDHITPANLLPKISIYDDDAIAYEYGHSTNRPSCKESYYAKFDKADPYAQDIMSYNIIEASELGLSALQNVYPKINSYVLKLPEGQNNWHTSDDISTAGIDLYDAYVYQVANLIGGRSIRSIIPKVNETSVTYVPKEKQLLALNFLNQNLFTHVPYWLNNDSLKRISGTNIEDHAVSLAKSVFTKLFSNESIKSLIGYETEYGNKAFTCNDLFNILDRMIFDDYNYYKSLSHYEYSMQSALVEVLISSVNQNNITTNLSDDSAMLHSYFIHVSDGIRKQADSNVDPSSRNLYQMMKIKLDHEYFNK